MVDTKTFVSKALEAFHPMKTNRTTSNVLSNLKLRFSGTVPIVHDGILVFRPNLDSTISSQGIDRHADAKRCGESHDDNQGVRGRVTQPTLVEAVLVDILLRRNRMT